MKRYVKPNTELPKPEEAAAPPPMSEISVARLIDDGLIALYREMKNLLMASAKGKLDATSAKDLRDHMKLLFELKAQEDASLLGVTDEQLEADAKAALEKT